MTQFSTLVTSLQLATGRNDATAIAVMKTAINAAVVAAALTFRSPELRTDTTVATAAGGSTSLSTLTRWVFIDEVYNTTAAARVWPVSFKELLSLPLPTTGSALFWCEYGGSIYYLPIPAVAENLKIHYLSLPAALVNDADIVPMPQHENFILSFAQAYVWAAFEETDSATLWTKVAESLGMSHIGITKIRDALEKQVPNVHDLQNSISEGTAAA